MNGIHEVTGSIPVWSTILRSRYPRASDSKPSELTHRRRMPTIALRSNAAVGPGKPPL